MDRRELLGWLPAGAVLGCSMTGAGKAEEPEKEKE
jgi:hypothetical protein